MLASSTNTNAIKSRHRDTIRMKLVRCAGFGVVGSGDLEVLYTRSTG